MAKILFSKLQKNAAFTTNDHGGSLTGIIPANLEAGILVFNTTQAPARVKLTCGTAANAIITLDPTDPRFTPGSQVYLNSHDSVDIDGNVITFDMEPGETFRFIVQNGTQAGNIVVTEAVAEGHTLVGLQQSNYISILRYQ